MSMRLDYRFAILLPSLLVAPLGCLEPTQALVEITTDSSCADVVSTGISAGLLGDIEKNYEAETSLCSDSGEIGSIVLIPPEDADKNAPFAFRVVTSLGAGVVENCEAPKYGPGCIVARRSMRFVPQRPFRVPVHLGQACAGIVCPDNQTCVEGTCRSAKIDPYDCDTAETCVPAGGDAPPWQKPIVGNGLQMVKHFAVAPDGSLVVTGAFEDSLNLGGEELVSKGDVDVFLAAISQGGLHKWSLSLGGSGREDISRVAVGPDGSVFVMFWFYDKIDFTELGGDELPSAGAADIAIAKFTSYAKLEWAIHFGGPSTEVPAGLSIDQEGNIFAVGSFSDTMTVGDQTIAVNGSTDAFLVSFTSAGNLRWAKSIGGADEDSGSAVGVDAKGRVYVAGYINGDVRFGPKAALSAVGQSDAFLASYDSDGSFRWVKSISTSTNDRIQELAVRGYRVVVTGAIGGKGEIAGKPLTASKSTGFVASFGTSGALAWVQRFGMPTGGVGESVAIGSDESIVLGGQISAETVFGSEPVTLTGFAHPFVAVLEREGAPRWAKVFSSTDYASALAVGAAPNDFAYIGGWFVGDLDLGVEKRLLGRDAEDGFLFRVARPLPPEMPVP